MEVLTTVINGNGKRHDGNVGVGTSIKGDNDYAGVDGGNGGGVGGSTTAIIVLMGILVFSPVIVVFIGAARVIVAVGGVANDLTFPVFVGQKELIG